MVSPRDIDGRGALEKCHQLGVKDAQTVTPQRGACCCPAVVHPPACPDAGANWWRSLFKVLAFILFVKAIS